jgi:glutathione S-transferase
MGINMSTEAAGAFADWNIEFTYFMEWGGRARLPQIILTDAGVAWTHNQIVDWPAMKQAGLEDGSFPFGKVPVARLTRGDTTTTLADSQAMARFFGKQTGAYPSDSIEAARVDEIFGFLADFQSAVVTLKYGHNFEESKTNEFNGTTAVYYAERIENYVGRTQGLYNDDAYLATQDFSIADAMLYDLSLSFGEMEQVNVIFGDKTQALINKIAARPNLAARAAP